MFWLGASALIALMTVSVRLTKSLAALVVYPLTTMALIYLFTFDFDPLVYVYEEADKLILMVSLAEMAFGILALPLLTAVCLLRTVYADRHRTLWLKVRVAVLSIAATTAVPVLIVGFAAIGLGYDFHVVTVIALAARLTVLVCTIRQGRRVIVLGVTGLWVLTMVMGWYWTATVDSGVDQFTGMERHAAKTRLAQLCTRDGQGVGFYNYGVVRDGDDFQKRGYHLWRLPFDCD